MFDSGNELVLILMFVGWAYCAFVFAESWVSYHKRAVALSEQAAPPTDVSAAGWDSAFTLEKLAGFYSAHRHLLQLNASGAIQLNQAQLDFQASSAKNNGLLMLVFFSHRFVSLIVMMGLGLVPMGFIACLGLWIYAFFQAHQASQFQVTYRRALAQIARPGGGEASASVSTELTRLSELFKSGALSEAEFRAAKQKLLQVQSPTGNLGS